MIAKKVKEISPSLTLEITAKAKKMKADGISEEKVQKVIEDGVFALNAKLPVYSQIAICELRHDPFVKTPKLSIKRFMYN
jgi:long-chain acyl-CoA synthetase